ncbi:MULTISPECIES: glycoside hydrolase family 3 protein [Kordiimonas]|jgi:beta-glucosidase|uniref:glycoside hydrolase family 3 protein n=1 Tax=Kordiimonas TaxID=288021 RepID=UPI00257B471B|nr:glycoside hydrolase family 3 protein [Kordiimonas sp. UBA4487]
MKYFDYRFFVVAAALALAGCGDAPTATDSQADKVEWPTIASPVKADPATDQKVASLLAKMSVEEKVGQIMQVEIQHISPEEVKTYHIGSVLNGGGSLPNRNKYAAPGEWLAMADAFYDASMDTSDGGLAIPIIWGSDAVHGHNNVIGATLFPHNIGLGAANNPELLRQIGAVTALEMRVTGIDWTFAPTLAVAQDDRWGRAYESYSENPEIVQAYGRAMVEGVQGVPGTPDFLDVDHVVSTAKHFIADGGTEGGDDQGDAKIPELELLDIHAAGYKGALAAGVQTAMASFSSWNGQKLHGSKYLLTDVLKGQMGFEGFIVGDWNGHGQVPGCTNASCATAINAGLDMFMAIEEWRDLYKNTLDQVNSGEISMARLDDAVSRILRVKIRAGLFEKGRPSDRGVAGQDGIIGQPEHRAVARQAVRESLVLLKNNGGLLPLNPSATVLVAGDGADNIGKQSGGWTITWQGTGNVNSDFPGATSIFDGIRDAVAEAGGTAVLSVDGSYDTKPDVAVVVFGEEPYAEGQGDIDTVEFEPGNKKSLALLKELKADGIPVVSVFLSGRPLWVNPELNASDAFVAAWLPGSEGEGVADVLVADAEGNPRHDFKGRLSFSWPANPLQGKLNLHDEGYAPLFPFGHGLTYADTDTVVGMLPEDVVGVAAASGGDLDLFVGRPMSPWRLFVASDQSSQVISGYYAQVPGGTMTAELVDKDIQADAVKVNWLSDGNGAFFMGDAPAMDLSDHAEAGAALRFDLRVDSFDATDASLSVRCGEACTRSLDIDEFLRASTGKGWATVAVPLACLSEDAADFETLLEPFRFGVTGKASMAFANIGVVKATETVDWCDPGAGSVPAN